MSTDQLTTGEILQHIKGGGLVLHQTERYETRLKVSNFRGVKRIDLRRYYPGEQGMLPTKAGVPIRLESLPLLIQALTAITSREAVV